MASCRQCGEQFERVQSNRKFCSSACRQAAHRARFPMTEAEKVKARECTRRWIAKYPERHRENRYRKYGITLADYERMAAQQGGVCALCGEPERRVRDDHATRRLSVDHDHATGQVRGLLCHRCNLSLRYNLTPDLLRKMADYIERNRGSEAA